MLPIENMRAVVESLLEKTKADQVTWRRDNPTVWPGEFPASGTAEVSTPPGSIAAFAFAAHFSQSIVRIAYFILGPGGERIQFRFQLADGSLLGVWVLLPSSTDWPLARSLLAEINQRVGPDMNFLLRDIGRGSEKIEVTIPPDPDGAPFFRKAAGEWEFASYRRDKVIGTELLRLDEQGYLYSKTRGPSPYMVLQNVFYSPQARNVGFTKVYAAGEMKGQETKSEVLEISLDGTTMRGYSQDGHPVKYERRVTADVGAATPDSNNLSFAK